MANGVELKSQLTADVSDYVNKLRTAREETRKLVDLTQEFKSINDEITEYTSFSFLLKEQLNTAVTNLKGVGEKSWGEFTKSTGEQLEKAFVGTWDAFTDNIGELDNSKLEKAWSDFGDSFTESIHTSWHGMLDNMGSALTGQVKDLGQEIFVDPVVGAFKTSFFDPLVDGLKSSIKGLLADFVPGLSDWLGLGASGNKQSLLKNIASDPFGVLSAGKTGLDIYSAVSGGFGTFGAIAAQKLGAALGLGPATLPSIIGPAAGSMGPGMGGAMTGGLAMLEIGPTAAELELLGVGLPTSMAPVETAGAASQAISEAMANNAALFDFGSQASLHSPMSASGVLTGIGSIAAVYEGGLMLANMLGTQGSAPHLWEIPGTIWEGFSGGGEGMTPEKATANWFGGGGSDGQGQGWMAAIEKTTANMQALGQSFDSLGMMGSNFEEFGESAQEAAKALEHLTNTGVMTQEQVDAMVASMNDLAQKQRTLY